MKKLSILITLLILFILPNCDHITNPEQDKYTGIIEGVNFDSLFASPTEFELQAISDEWQNREIISSNINVVFKKDLSIGSKNYDLRVISQEINNNIHYFATINPQNADENSLPILTYLHGGESGVNISKVTTFSEINVNFREMIDNFIIVIPSFRSEPIIINDSLSFISEGEPSPWNYDVDDALASIQAAIDITPEIDSSQIAIFGISRGACVGMLMSIRDPKIDVVVEFFGPTDFLGDYVKEILYQTLKGGEYDLPGFNYLNENYIQPLKNDENSIEETRIELIRRSPVYFINDLAPLQVHHGTADEIVLISQAERIIEVCNKANFNENRFESYIYDSYGHNEFTVMYGMENALRFINNFITYP